MKSGKSSLEFANPLLKLGVFAVRVVLRRSQYKLHIFACRPGGCIKNFLSLSRERHFSILTVFRLKTLNFFRR